MYIALSNKQEFIALAKTVEQLENYINKYNFHSIDIFKLELGINVISILHYTNYIKTIE